MTADFKHPLGKPGMDNTPPIVQQALVIRIQEEMNAAEPMPNLHVPLTGKLDTETTQRLFDRYGDVRNLREMDLDASENERLKTMPPALWQAIATYQSAASSQEGRLERSEQFNPFTSHKSGADIYVPQGKLHREIPPLINQFRMAHSSLPPEEDVGRTNLNLDAPSSLQERTFRPVSRTIDLN